MAKVGNPSGASAIDELCGLTVGVGLGTVEEAAVRNETEKCVSSGKSKIKIMTFPDVATGARLIDSGRADIILWDLGFVDSRVKDAPEKYSRAFLILSGFQIGAGVANGNEELLQAIYSGLSEIQKTGKQAEIFAAYQVDNALSLDAEVLRD